jgi:hypothetical protein
VIVSEASTPDDHPQMVQDCWNRKMKLSEWEINFITNIRAQIARNQPLRPAQVTVLDELWEKVT